MLTYDPIAILIVGDKLCTATAVRRGHCRKYGDSLKRPLQELSLGWTNFTWIYKVLVSQMAVVKHFLEQPCTRGSDNFFTFAPHGRTVPRRYRRVLGYLRKNVKMRVCVNVDDSFLDSMPAERIAYRVWSGTDA